MPRKIYQISTCHVENTYQTQSNMATTVLCDDGSVWKLYDNVNPTWQRLPDIPQDKLSRNDLEPPPTTEWRGRGQEKYEGRDIGDLK